MGLRFELKREREAPIQAQESDTITARGVTNATSKESSDVVGRIIRGAVRPPVVEVEREPQELQIQYAGSTESLQGDILLCILEELRELRLEVRRLRE